MQFESDIPMPSPARGGKSKYDFGAMTPGDSFAVDWDADDGKQAKRARCAAFMHGGRKGWKMASRTVREGGARKVRIWRVS